jgi:hypothetical protein
MNLHLSKKIKPMPAIAIDTFRDTHSIQSQKYRDVVNNKLLFNLFLLRSLPMGFIAGLRVREFTAERCSIGVPYKWLNQNPFSSTYFAVLAMAAEMSSGMVAMMHTYKSSPSISMLVTNLEADFVKKATGMTTFTCESGGTLLQAIEDCITTGEGQTVKCLSTGRSGSGEVIAKFTVTWSFKARSK